MYRLYVCINIEVGLPFALSRDSLGIFLSIKISFLFIYWRVVPSLRSFFLSDSWDPVLNTSNVSTKIQYNHIYALTLHSQAKLTSILPQKNVQQNEKRKKTNINIMFTKSSLICFHYTSTEMISVCMVAKMKSEIRLMSNSLFSSLELSTCLSDRTTFNLLDLLRTRRKKKLHFYITFIRQKYG